MDIQMPGMDGYEATRRIRASERANGRAPTPIVALTAHAMSTEVKRCLIAGCDGHLAKPITRSTLLDSIAEHARKRGQRRPTKAKPGGASAAIPPEELASLVPQYLAACQSQVADLQRAIDRGDLELVARHAHNLRGSGTSFGFPPITELGVRLEHALSARDLTQLKQDAAALQHYLET